MARTKKRGTHTPAPWKWRGYPSTQVIALHDDGSERGVVAQVGTDGGAFSKQEACWNASLIAASPRLYAAAKAINDNEVPSDDQWDEFERALLIAQGL